MTATDDSVPLIARRLVDDGGETVGLPKGRRVRLEGRGLTFVREVEGPPGAPTVLLVHGWLASAGMNWYRVFEPLGEHFHVVAPDLRGHGRGIRSNRRFRLRDCADDLAALVETLGCGPVVAAGYSLGGPVTQLLWQRHPDSVAGLVQCSTTHAFGVGRREQLIIGELSNFIAGMVRLSRVANTVPRQMMRWTPRYRTRPSSLRRWAAKEARRHDARMILEAAAAGTWYDASAWIGDIDVPTTIVATDRDRALSLDLQLETARRIAGATVRHVDDDHLALSNPEYPSVLVEACLEVAERAGVLRR